MRSILRHITPLGINSLRVDTHTNTHTHTDVRTRTILRNQACIGHRPVCAQFKSKSPGYFLRQHSKCKQNNAINRDSLLISLYVQLYTVKCIKAVYFTAYIYVQYTLPQCVNLHTLDLQGIIQLRAHLKCSYKITHTISLISSIVYSWALSCEQKRNI